MGPAMTRGQAWAGPDSGANLDFEHRGWQAADRLCNNVASTEHKRVVLGRVFPRRMCEAFEQGRASLEREATDADGAGASGR